MIKPLIRQRVSQHSEIIAILALVGKRKGYDVWVGKREQSDKDSGVIKNGKLLKDYMTIDSLKGIDVENKEVIENIDLLWIKNKKVKIAYEVESTTSMTSALLRGSNLAKEISKFIVIPEERRLQLENKMSSPLFEQHFTNENWNVLYFDALRNNYLKYKSNIDLDALSKDYVVKDEQYEYATTQIEMF